MSLGVSTFLEAVKREGRRAKPTLRPHGESIVTLNQTTDGSSAGVWLVIW